MKSVIKIILISISLFLTSCIKDVDFDQADQFELNPTITASLIKFSLDQDQLHTASLNSNFPVTDKASFNLFNGFKKRKNITKIDLEIEIENPFDRKFIINLSFVTGNGDIAYILPLEIAPNDILKYTKTIKIGSTPKITDTTEVLISLDMVNPNSIPIDPLLKQNFTFKSAGTFHYTIK